MRSLTSSLSIFALRNTHIVAPMLKATTTLIDEATVLTKTQKKKTKKDTIVAMTCAETATIPPPKSPESASTAPKRRALYAASRAATADARVGPAQPSASLFRTADSAAKDAPKRRGGIAQAASFASRRVAAIVSSLEKSFEERKVDEVKKTDGVQREKRRYGGNLTATRFLHGIAEREQELARKEKERQEVEEKKRKEEEDRRASTESLARMVRRGRSALSAVNGRRLEPVLEGIQVEAIPETKLRKAKKYTGAATTGKIGEILARGEEEKEEEQHRRHLVGFTHRKSHLSLSSQLSGTASFYLIGHRGRGAPGRYDDSTMGSESDARVLSDEGESGGAGGYYGYGGSTSGGSVYYGTSGAALRNRGTMTIREETEDKDNDADCRGSMSTDLTSVSRQHEKMMARRRKAQRTYRRPSRASSFSSITESSMSLHVETVTLNMDTVNFLGISIVGQSSVRGDNGIYVANVMKGGAVALDGRIEPGDMILQVNEVAFDNFTNDQAVDVLRDEPVRPIDTGAWIQHTNAMRGAMPSILEGSEGAPTPLPGDRLHHHQQPRPATSSSATSTGSNGQNTVVGGGSGGMPGTLPPIPRLELGTDKKRVVEVMTRPGSGLDIKNRTWLKISIPMSFLGSDLVDWLLEHISGLRERKEARKYAAELLKFHLIAHVVNKITFTEQCYYVLGDACADIARYRQVDGGVNGGPVPTWQWGGAGTGPRQPGIVQGSMVSGYASMPMSPHPPMLGGVSGVRHFGGEGSQISSTDGSGSSEAHRRSTRPVVLPPPPAAAPVGSSGRLDEIPHDVAASRQSFRIAMANPYEFFVDNL
ncbi:hypothetical protein PENTCL1PPCAC_9310 [Pristionchus entomophagus]|uniref:Dsh-1 n=1 Tax=Pristionchus entomophagus TaxID=358040 RepID=A0AAV5T469_9BILA|nr:hypothetical protein PENTCL1PPCAC_9310 [Pristionchus entomophagus]